MKKSRVTQIEAYLRAYFVEVSKESEHIMKMLHTEEQNKCDFCSGIAHFDAPLHNGGLEWHNLCEICMSTEGDSEHAIRLVHNFDCKYCDPWKRWEDKQSVLPF